MANIDHIMPQPFVIPIYWGSDYDTHRNVTSALHKLVVALVTGPFMNNLAQYGVRRGTVNAPIVIDDLHPPNTLVWTDANNNFVDEITPHLMSWIDAGVVPPVAQGDVNQLYLIIPPPVTTLLYYKSEKDRIGNGVQAWHNEGRVRSGLPSCYWAIVKANDVGPISTINAVQTFVDNLGPKISHELVEQFVDRDGSFEEIGDPCLGRHPQPYRGWTVEQYHSDWDTSPANPCGCVNGDDPVSLRKFLSAVGFDSAQGLRALGMPDIGVDSIAVYMQSRSANPPILPKGCYG
ncbi:MAG TPA: hypothetical protein VF116_10130 [Ktedonobacterales bacterium]